jgi:DNA-binding MurR/RpiR family transcriptional regulator
MEMRLVRYSLAVADTLNFRRAAEQCNVSQPALTRAIQQLEEELGELLPTLQYFLGHYLSYGNRLQRAKAPQIPGQLADESLSGSSSVTLYLAES